MYVKAFFFVLSISLSRALPTEPEGPDSSQFFERAIGSSCSTPVRSSSSSLPFDSKTSNISTSMVREHVSKQQAAPPQGLAWQAIAPAILPVWNAVLLRAAAPALAVAYASTLRTRVRETSSPALVQVRVI